MVNPLNIKVSRARLAIQSRNDRITCGGGGAGESQIVGEKMPEGFEAQEAQTAY